MKTLIQKAELRSWGTVAAGSLWLGDICDVKITSQISWGLHCPLDHLFWWRWPSELCPFQTLLLGKAKWSLGGGVCRSLERGVGWEEFGPVSPGLSKLLSRSWAQPLLYIFVPPGSNLACDSGLPRLTPGQVCGEHVVQLLHHMPKGSKVQNSPVRAVLFPQGHASGADLPALCPEPLLALGPSALSIVLCTLWNLSVYWSVKWGWYTRSWCPGPLWGFHKWSKCSVKAKFSTLLGRPIAIAHKWLVHGFLKWWPTVSPLLITSWDFNMLMTMIPIVQA